MRTALLLLIFQLGHASSWTHQSNKPPPEPHPADTTDSFVMSECLNEKYTRLSCAKVFCPPWRRCIAGQCVCKLPYQCLQTDKRVCGMDGKPYLSLCQVQALACKTKQPMFSHFDKGCKDDHVFKVQLKQFDGKEVVQVKSKEVEALVCATDYWDMAAANVVCRQKKGDARGAIATGRIGVSSISARLQLPAHCMSVRCTGSEFSLAECTLYQPQNFTLNTNVTWVKCHKQGSGPENISGFSCVNKKVISLKHTCDGVDHCGDYSDEMCCKSCRRKAFRCRSGVCIPRYAVNDKIRDCLGGEDEVENQIPLTEHPTETAREEPEVEKDSRPDVTPHSTPVKHEEHEHEEHKKDSVPHVEETPWSNPTDDIRETRRIAEKQLQCGIPNMDYVYKTEDQTRRTRRTRQKRVVGGAEALPTQIQWQVAVQEDGKIHCGGVFLGGCWVLTAAHCVRQKPQSFRIKFSLWKKSSLINTTDNIPVKKIIVHERYDPQTYLNDIALVQLEELAFEKVCVSPNPAVRSVCVPWSIMQFQPGDTCTISGWGRNKEGDSSNALKWANVTLIGECKKYYKERFHEGMECAGDVEGKVDSCQGDSGGPLVCKDASGLSYVWGIVSWGEKCGEPGFPGVYTKVAHYFEWIRSVTGWPAVTKYNH